MTIDWGSMLTIFLAIILASLVEHMVIAPRMEHSPAKTAALTLTPKTASDVAASMFPNAVTV